MISRHTTPRVEPIRRSALPLSARRRRGMLLPELSGVLPAKWRNALLNALTLANPVASATSITGSVDSINNSVARIMRARRVYCRHVMWSSLAKRRASVRSDTATARATSASRSGSATWSRI